MNPLYRKDQNSDLDHWGCLSHKLVDSVGSGRCWFIYDWGVIGFCPQGTRDTSLGGEVLLVPGGLFFGRKSFFCAYPPISLPPSWLDTKKTTFLCCSCCWASSREVARAQKIWFLCFPLYCMVLYGTACNCLVLMVQLSFHVVSWYFMLLYCILWYCMVLHCWLWRAGCISQDTYILYPFAKRVS